MDCRATSVDVDEENGNIVLQPRNLQLFGVHLQQDQKLVSETSKNFNWAFVSEVHLHDKAQKFVLEDLQKRPSLLQFDQGCGVKSQSTCLVVLYVRTSEKNRG